MKRPSSFALIPILSLTLTLSPVLAQTPGAPKSDDANPTVEQPAVPAPSGQVMDERNSDDGTQVLSALPPSDSSNPPGRTSRAVIIGVIIGGAALITALILAFHGSKTSSTVLIPGTATVGPPGQ